MKVERVTHCHSEEGSRYHYDKCKRRNKVLVHRVECAILESLMQRAVIGITGKKK